MKKDEKATQKFQIEIVETLSNVLGRRFIGIEQETEYLQLSQARYEDLQDAGRKEFFKQHFYRLLNKEDKS